ncbi:MAG: DinB family protein [Saprospiraceae bacterium]|nr:DinB family protein [Saprospiraceae bacterium]
MKEQFDLQKITRQNVANKVAGLSLDALNTIPAGLSNNLAWNLGHIIVTQQLLLYRLSGVNCRIENEYIERYRKGSRPEGRIEQAEIDFLLQQLVITADVARVDFQNQHFGTYKSYTTSYGITLDSIEEAIMFNNAHESMHLGTMICLGKLVA